MNLSNHKMLKKNFDMYKINDEFEIELDEIERSGTKNIVMEFPNGKEIKGRLIWEEYKPKIETDEIIEHFGCKIKIEPKMVIKRDDIAKKYIIDNMADMGISVDILEGASIIKRKTGNKSYPVINEYKYTLVKGLVQSGKTFFIIYQTLMNLIQGLSTLIIVRNLTSDQHQLINRLKEKVEELNKIIGKKNNYKMSICDSARCHKIFEKNSGPLIVVALANYKQLGIFRDLVDDKSLYKKIIVMIDEVDFIDTNSSDKKSEIILDLKYMALQVYGVSATVTDTIIQEEILSNRVKILKPSNIYKGIDQINWFELKPCVKKYKQNLLEYDPDLSDFMDKFSRWEPIFVDIYNDYHPILYLMKFTHLIDKMEELQDFIKDKYSDKITTLVYNGKGVRLYIGEKHKKILINKRSIEINCEQYFDIKNIGISDVVGYLKNNGGYIKWKRILIISGELASRGISFVSSDYGKCLKNGKLGWHIIGEYFRCSDTMKQPELLQSARLCGNIKDNIPLRWYTTTKIKDDIIKAYHIAEKLLNDSLKISCNQKISLKTSVFEIPIQKSELVAKRKIARNQNIDKSLKIIHDKTTFAQNDIGHVFIILFHTLSNKSRQYYDFFIRAFIDHFGIGIWVKKSKIMDYVADKYNIDAKLLTDTCHPWHDKNKKSNKTIHYQSSNNEFSKGLLFKKNTHAENAWYMCYNN